MRWALCILCLATGCGFDNSANARGANLGDDGGPSDSGFVVIDADLSYSCEKWDPVHLAGCDLPQSGGDLILADSEYVFDTNVPELRDGQSNVIPVVTHPLSTDRGDAIVLVTESFTLESTASLRVVGTHALVISSRTDIRVLGTLDVSSSRGARGAGSNPGACSATAAVAGGGTTNATGGGGGGFFGEGGAGGLNSDSSAAGGAGGDAVPLPAGIGGGCPGAQGGGFGTQNPGVGGPGGGALILLAYLSITVDAEVDAGGAGGQRGGSGTAAGGGGGSGGLIGFDAPMVTLGSSAVVTANGGGGGQGSDNGGPGPQNGFDGQRSIMRAPGGDTSSEGGTGGSGGALEDPDGETPRNDPDGTGGGGGAGGFIIDYRGSATTVQGAVVSPALQAGTSLL